VRSGGESPTQGDANLLPASVPDIGRSLQSARQHAELTVGEAARRAGLTNVVVEALEAGNVGPQHDRIGTLRALRTYAGSLGLPGDEYVLVAVEQWPSNGHVPMVNGDTAVVPVVSISSAPAGGHTPAGGHGSVWPGDANGVPDATTTGIIEASRISTINDTGRMRALDTGIVPAVDTGQVRAVKLGVPRLLKFMLWLVSILIVLGAAALIEHNNIDGWYHDTRTTTTRWVNDVKSALGISSTTGSHHHHTTTTTSPGGKKTAARSSGPKVTVKNGANGLSATINVASPSFTVKIVAVGRPCWIEATGPGQTTPLFAGDLLANETHTFTVTQQLTVQTGSAAGRAFVYEGSKLVTFYFPPKAPFTLSFSATG
jgi:cytoskeletal protein RodZ